MSKTKSSQNITYWQTIKTIIPAYVKAMPPIYFILDNLSMPISTCWYVLATYVMQNLFDTVKNAVQGSASYQEVINIVLITIGVQIMSQVINLSTFIISQPIKVTVKGVLDRQIHSKTARLKAIDFEDAEMLDCITKAKEGAASATILYSSVSSLLLFYGPYILAISFYLYSLRPLLLLSLLFIFIPLLISQLVKGRVFSRFVDEAAPLERKLDYYQKTIYHREYFKETRILGLFGFCNRLYSDTLALFNFKRWQADLKTGIVDVGLRLLTLSGFFGVLYLLFSSLMDGYISVGAFAAVFASMNQIFGELEHALSYYLSNLMENMGAIKSYVKFLNLPEHDGTEKELDYRQGISLCNVSFCYPNAEKEALSNITLDIKPGETLALVGENGAGKTTLVRILTGILQPTKGEILVGGENLDGIAPASLYAKISGVFQKFQKYKMPLVNNVTISDMDSELNTEKVNKVLEQADLQMDGRYEHGLETMLAREFDGIDLSGGEWQRISLARGLYRGSDLIILDEPTSAIDPIEESKLYRKFIDISSDKIAVIVTHRLGSAKIADRIVVLDKGQIDAIGTHEQLMAEVGLYASMYNSQAKWYAVNAE